MAGQFRFKNNSGTVVAQISASNAGAMSFSGSALDFSSVTTLTLGTTTLSGTASFATTAVSSSYGLNALTGSNAMTASSADTLYVRNNATVLGSITAQTLVVQTITSSVLFTTGSNKIGSSLSNVQELTGSVGITGSLAINGTTAVVGSGTANYVPKFTASGTIGNSAITDDGTTVTLVSRALSGTSATFSSTGFFGSDIFTYVNGGIFFNGTGTYTSGIFQQSGGTLALQTGGTPRLTIASTGAATFSSSVTATQGIFNNAGQLLSFQRSGTERWKVENNSSHDLLISGLTSGGTYYIFQNSVETFSLNTTRAFFGTNVGIGTSSPSAISTYTTLDIRGATGGGIRMGVAGNSTPFNLQQAGTDAYLNNVANGAMYFLTNDVERMRITSGGVVQINNAGDAQLHINASGATGYVKFDNSSSDTWGAGIGFNIATNFELYNFSTATYGFRITRSGIYGTTVSSPRSVFVQSDGTLGGISSVRESKTNINKLDSSWLMQLNPVSFNYRKKDAEDKYTNEHYDELYYGLIAEEAELVNKEICTYNDNKLIGIEYSKLVPVLIEAIKELSAKVTLLENK